MRLASDGFWFVCLATYTAVRRVGDGLDARRGERHDLPLDAGISGVAVAFRMGRLPDFALAVSAPAARVPAATVSRLTAELRMTADALAATAGLLRPRAAGPD